MWLVLDQPSTEVPKTSMMLRRMAETVFREIGEARASEASRTKEVTTLTAKQHFPSHAHTSTAVKENNSVFHRSLLCKTHKKIPDNEMH